MNLHSQKKDVILMISFFRSNFFRTRVYRCYETITFRLKFSPYIFSTHFPPFWTQQK